ncbi:MAG: hypothetical protein ACR2IK_07030 [Chloroflexota bacterium]
MRFDQALLVLGQFAAPGALGAALVALRTAALADESCPLRKPKGY